MTMCVQRYTQYNFILSSNLCLCRAHNNLVLNPSPWPDDSNRHPDILFIF